MRRGRLWWRLWRSCGGDEVGSVCGGERIKFGASSQFCADGVLVDVVDVGNVVVRIGDAVVCVTSFPDVQFALELK